jgi:hypothetical protein
MNNNPSKPLLARNARALRRIHSNRLDGGEFSMPPPDLKVMSMQGPEPSLVRRLVILVPNEDVNDAQFASRIWDLALPPKAAILLLGLCPNSSEEFHMQRRLITLAAFVRHPSLRVESHILYGRNWQRGVKSLLQDGDAVVFLEQHFVGLRHLPLEESLRGLNVPLWSIAGLLPIRRARRWYWLSDVTFWVGAAAIIALFFYLQVQLNDLSDEVTRNIFLIMSVFSELGLLHGWNLLFS